MKRKVQYYLYRIWIILLTPFRNIYVHFKMWYWGVRLGKRIVFHGNIRLVNMNQMSIGNDTRFHSGYTNFVGGYQRTAIWVGQNAVLKIGNNVGISNATIVTESSIIIEDEVFIGGGTKMYDNDFHAIDKESRLNNPTVIPSLPIVIKRGAFIGGHSIILKGVIIGENSVIGASSLVVKNIPPNEIWAGVPARKIKDL
jgi:acetyltransferase-like isoleucine patch superfamily enzyme